MKINDTSKIKYEPPVNSSQTFGKSIKTETKHCEGSSLECLAAQGKSQVKSPRNEFFDSEGKKVIFKDGRATYENNKPYGGTVEYRDKNGNAFSFIFSRGELKYSAKNGEILKEYSSGNSDNCDSVVKFPDGSMLQEQDYYNYHIGDIHRFRVANKESGKVTCVARNMSPKYKGEPRIIIETQNGEEPKVTQRFLNEEGEEKINFSSVDEANEYFMSEYKIDAHFDSICQAHLMKNAIDDFIKLKKENKELFEGLIIKTGELPDGINGRHSIDCNCSYNEDELISEGVNIEDMEEVLNYVYRHESCPITVNSNTIILNSNSDWNQMWDFSNECANKPLLSYGRVKMQNMYHELGHFLHGKTSLRMFICSGRFPFADKQEEYTAGIVSVYAMTNPKEFVAEYISGRMYGIKYPIEVDDLYKKYGGPDLFDD